MFGLRRSSCTLRCGTAAVLAAALTATARAESVDEGAAAGGDRSIAVEVGLGWASAYVWRGENVFQSSRQMDQHGLLAPSATITFGDSGVSLGYWGAFQLNGANRGALVDEGVGAEQDVMVAYDFSIAGDVAGAAAIGWYLYPLADQDVAGATPPCYLEPRVSATWSGPLEVGMTAAYYQGLAGWEDDRYLYLAPAVAHSREIHPRATLDVGLALGFKAPLGGGIGDGAFDATLDVGSTMPFAGRHTLTPAVHLAWTNLGGVSFGHELVVWASVDLAASL